VYRILIVEKGVEYFTTAKYCVGTRKKRVFEKRVNEWKQKAMKGERER